MRTLTILECLLDDQCVRVNEFSRWCSLQTEFFCGLDQECTRPLDASVALSKAKQNLREKFAVVGVLEDLSGSLKVLQARLPTYFDSISTDGTVARSSR